MKGAMRTKRDHKQSKKEAPPARRSPLWARLLLAFVSPLVFLAIMELVLMLAGYGRARTFFIKWRHHDQPIYLMNHQCCEHFVPKALSRVPEYSVLRPKALGSRRIFVPGSSAAYGDPKAEFGFCRQLEVLLNAQCKGVSYEVINVAVTAMNSHVARRIALDCAGHQPDIFIVYMGNNEIVGPYGPPTLPKALYASRGFINTCITLKQRFRVGQLLSHVIETVRMSGQPQQEWLGMETFLSTQMPAHDPKLNYCYQHLQDNIHDIVWAADACGARTLLCTVPVNLRACAPFGSQHGPGLSAGQLTQWERHFHNGRQGQQSGDYETALRHYEQAASLDDAYADLAYCRAQCLEALGRIDNARVQYGAARDLDTLRFRADSMINNVIRTQAGSLARYGVTLFDMEDYLKQATGGLPLGAEILVDHVHLSFRGNFLAAYGALSVIRGCFPEDPWTKETWTKEQLFDLCAGRLLYDDLQHRDFARIMYYRKTLPPFVNQIDHDKELEGLRDELIRLYRNAKDMPVREADLQEGLKCRPADTYIYQRYGMYLVDQGRIREAEDMYEGFLEARPFNMSIRLELANLLAWLNQKDKALNLLMSKSTPYRHDRREALRALGSHLVKQGRFMEAEPIYLELLQLEVRNVDALNNLAVINGQKNTLHKVKMYLDKALAIDPESTKARINMGNYYASINQPDRAQAWFAKAVAAEPHNCLAHIGLGSQYLRAGKLQEGLSHIQEAVALRPDYVRGYELLEIIHRKLGQEEQARSCEELKLLFTE